MPFQLPVWNALCSHKKKRAKQIKKLMQRGLMDPEKADPFSLFLETSDITYCLYKDSERVLGNTFGMCILQVCLSNIKLSLVFLLFGAAVVWCSVIPLY